MNVLLRLDIARDNHFNSVFEYLLKQLFDSTAYTLLVGLVNPQVELEKASACLIDDFAASN